MWNEFPNLSVELLADDDVLDLVASGIDVAVRVGELADSKLQVRRLGTERGWVAVRSDSVYAAALSETKVERRLEVLAALPWVGYNKIRDGVYLRSVDGDENGTLDVQYRAHSSSGHGLMKRVLEGVGVGILSESMFLLGGSALRSPLPEFVATSFPVWALTPAKRYPVARVRVLLDRISERLRRPIWPS